MLRKLVLFGSAVALVGSSLFISGLGASAAVTPVDATHYTIQCDTLSKGTVGFKPSLLIGGSSPSVATLKGTLSGCSVTPSGGGDPVTVVSGSVAGTLSSSSNDCLSLLGPSTSTGTIKWKVASGQKLSNATTTLTVSSGNVTGGTASPFGDSATYGQFGISGTTQTGPFSGPSGTGAASFTKALTVEGVGALTPQCSPPSKGLKAVTLGSTEVSLG